MRKLTSIALLGLLAMISLGQAPPPEAKPKKAPEPKPLTLEEATAEAVRYHPDVRAAAAEVELAQAKWLQTKHNVAIKVATAKRAFANLAEQVVVEERGYRIALLSLKEAKILVEQMQQVKNAISATELKQMGLMVSQQEMQVAVLEKAMVKLKGELANAEADYATFAISNENRLNEKVKFTFDLASVESLTSSKWAATQTASVTGSFANQLREAFDKKSKLDSQKEAHLELVFSTILGSANVAGMVRVPRQEQPTVFQNAMRIDLPAGEHSLATWLQLAIDEANDNLSESHAGQPGQQRAKRYELFIREYGLLLADAKNPPSDTITVGEFLKQVRAEKAK